MIYMHSEEERSELCEETRRNHYYVFGGARLSVHTVSTSTEIIIRKKKRTEHLVLVLQVNLLL